MAKEALPLLLLSLLLSFLLLSSGNTNTLVNPNGQLEKTWCVATPSADITTLNNNIQYACAEVNCDVISECGKCFNPDTVFSHASVAMNLYYQMKGRNPWNCDFKGSGLVSAFDPSYDYCNFA